MLSDYLQFCQNLQQHGLLPYLSNAFFWNCWQIYSFTRLLIKIRDQSNKLLIFIWKGSGVGSRSRCQVRPTPKPCSLCCTRVSSSGWVFIIPASGIHFGNQPASYLWPNLFDIQETSLIYIFWPEGHVLNPDSVHLISHFVRNITWKFLENDRLNFYDKLFAYLFEWVCISRKSRFNWIGSKYCLLSICQKSISVVMPCHIYDILLICDILRYISIETS